MHKIQWNDSLSVGVDAIDRQHKIWIEHFNNVVDAFESGHGQERIIETLGFLSDYTSTHFAMEDRLMVSANYPELDAHRAKHKELTGTVDDLVRDFREDGVSQQLADAIETLLGNWLIKHIENVDRSFGDYVQEHSIALDDED